jgi:hypothetical protein
MKSEVKISGNRLQITRVFDAPPSACVCMVDASGEVAAVVWLQGGHEVRD